MKKLSILLVFLSLLICLVSCKPKEYTVTLKVDGEIYETCVVKEEEKLTLPTPSKIPSFEETFTLCIFTIKSSASFERIEPRIPTLSIPVNTIDAKNEY